MGMGRKEKPPARTNRHRGPTNRVAVRMESALPLSGDRSRIGHSLSGSSLIVGIEGGGLRGDDSGIKGDGLVVGIEVDFRQRRRRTSLVGRGPSDSFVLGPRLGHLLCIEGGQFRFQFRAAGGLGSSSSSGLGICLFRSGRGGGLLDGGRSEIDPASGSTIGVDDFDGHELATVVDPCLFLEAFLLLGHRYLGAEQKLRRRIRIHETNSEAVHNDDAARTKPDQAEMIRLRPADSMTPYPYEHSTIDCTVSFPASPHSRYVRMKLLSSSMYCS